MERAPRNAVNGLRNSFKARLTGIKYAMLKQIRLMIYLSITCLFTVLIVACGSSDGGAAQQTISLKLTDSGKTVTVRQNDLITVTLDGNQNHRVWLVWHQGPDRF